MAKTKTEIYNLSFTTTPNIKGRITIPEATRQVANIKQGDSVTLTLTHVHHKEP